MSRKGRSRGVCVECHRDMVMYGRGLCTTCYDRAKTAGRLAEYPPMHVNRRASVAALVDEGLVTPKAVADRLGITRNAAFMALSKLRHEGYGVPSQQQTPPWLRLVPAPPTDVPCTGEAMDFDGLKPHELTPARNPAVADALSFCAGCPLPTRQWCLDVMDPRGLGDEWQGVAGGIVWSHGRVVYIAAEPVEAAS